MFFHPKWDIMPLAYVDDFKMAGPAGNLPAAWASIAQTKMEKPTTVGRLLGCNHAVHDFPDRKEIEWNMSDFLGQCLEGYVELTPGETKFVKVKTPFLDEATISEDDESRPGILSSDASKVLMKVQ